MRDRNTQWFHDCCLQGFRGAGGLAITRLLTQMARNGRKQRMDAKFACGQKTKVTKNVLTQWTETGSSFESFHCQVNYRDN